MTDGEAFGVVTSGYYKNPYVQLATRALRHWLVGVAQADEAELARMMVLCYVFVRISQETPGARAAFVPLLQAYDGPNAELPQQLLLLPETLPNALDVPMERPEVLDLLWAEFFVTGRPAPIERIFSALDQPDLVRERLGAWVRESSLFGRGKRRDTAAALADAGLVVDLERKAIVSTGDLDCLCFAIAERRIPIFKLLPFQLTQDQLLQLGTKASAVWSLRLNARDHERVAEISRVEAKRPGGPGRLLAAEPVGAAAPFVL